MTTSMVSGRTSAIRDEVVRNVRLHLGSDGTRARTPRDRYMELDPDLWSSPRDTDAVVPVQRAADEPVHAGHLERRVSGVAREHVGGDDGMSFHQANLRRTSSVTSGRAKNRNGTKVVPRPGETCSVTSSSRYRPSVSRERRCARRIFPPG